jgi:hypothetical protein
MERTSQEADDDVAEQRGERDAFGSQAGHVACSWSNTRSRLTPDS